MSKKTKNKPAKPTVTKAGLKALVREIWALDKVVNRHQRLAERYDKLKKAEYKKCDVIIKKMHNLEKGINEAIEELGISHEEVSTPEI